VLDREGAEWNTVALGPSKRRLADDLMRRLKTRFTKGALLHYGQGKWYPGESLPRWAFAAIGAKTASLSGSMRSSSLGIQGLRPRREASRTVHSCAGPAPRLRRQIHPAGIRGYLVLPLEGAPLPTNVDPFKSNLKEPEDRARLAKIFEQGLEKVIGYVLPVQRSEDAETPAGLPAVVFASERCYLIPAIPPSASVCRWIPCRGPSSAIFHISTNRTRSKNALRCPASITDLQQQIPALLVNRRSWRPCTASRWPATPPRKFCAPYC